MITKLFQVMFGIISLMPKPVLALASALSILVTSLVAVTAATIAYTSVSKYAKWIIPANVINSVKKYSIELKDAFLWNKLLTEIDSLPSSNIRRIKELKNEISYTKILIAMNKRVSVSGKGDFSANVAKAKVKQAVTMINLNRTQKKLMS
jgi:hypothetical protein